MFPGVLALLERSLRVDARALGTHLARFSLMAVIYAAVVLIMRTSDLFGAPGKRFIIDIAYLDLTFMTLLGIGFFSTVITEEKEDGALGLMLMAGISPLGILLGKAGGRLVQALLLVAVQYPFTLLAVTMGGVTRAQIQAAYMAMLAFMVMLSGVGLFYSTLAHRNRTASRCLFISIFAYWLMPVACDWYIWYFGGNVASFSPLVVNVLGWVSESCVFFQIQSAMTTGSAETFWTRQVISNLVVGALGFFLSWAMFGLAVRDPSIETHPRGMVTRSVGSGRWFSPGRPWSNPIAWKDFHFIAGGKPAVIVRFAFYVTLFLVVYVVVGILTPSSPRMNPNDAAFLYLTVAMFPVFIDAGLVVSRSLYDEVRWQTFGTLTLLPTSTSKILYSKIAGSLLVWLPCAICFLGGMILLPGGGRYVAAFFEFPMPAIWIWGHLILLPHLATVFAIYARWGAALIAIACVVGSGFLSLLVFQVIVPAGIGHGFNFEAMSRLGLAFLTIYGTCHYIVWRRAADLKAA